MNARKLGLTQADAARIAEISARTGQRIESGKHQPNRGQMVEQRTVPDPLAGVWENELEPMLRRDPRLQPIDSRRRYKAAQRHRSRSTL